VFDAGASSGSGWVLAGIAYLVFRLISRVEALEKQLAELLAQKANDSEK
jgi:hypothetical protein